MDRFDGFIAGLGTSAGLRVVAGRRAVRAGPLALAFTVGRRPPLGALLRAVPEGLATDPRWGA